MSKKKPGQILAIALNPLGYLLQGSRTGSTILNVVAPHHYLLLRSQGLTHRQQVAAVQADAHTAILAAPPPLPVVAWQPTPAPASRAWYAVGVAVLGGAIVVVAAYFGRRRR
jgi:hypothetical protein